MNLQNSVKKPSLLEISPNLRIRDVGEEQPILLEEESTFNKLQLLVYPVRIESLGVSFL